MKRKYILMITAAAILTGLYIYYRGEAQKKGSQKTKFWASLFGVPYIPDLTSGQYGGASSSFAEDFAAVQAEEQAFLDQQYADGLISYEDYIANNP